MRILIAEDDSVLADGLSASLRECGYCVDRVATGAEVLSAVASFEFDLLILDLGLPRMNGLEVLQRLRAKSAGLAVLILTAQDGVEARVRGLDLGADDYLAKPFALEELKARVRALTRRGAGARRRRSSAAVSRSTVSAGWRRCAARRSTFRAGARAARSTAAASGPHGEQGAAARPHVRVGRRGQHERDRGIRASAPPQAGSRRRRDRDGARRRLSHPENELRLKIALFADIHSNLEAVTACLAHAEGLGADRRAFLGDLVGYGADPAAVLELIERHVAGRRRRRDGQSRCGGAGPPGRCADGKRPGGARLDARAARHGHRAFLASLPLTVERDNALYVHASAAAPEQWIYVTGLREAAESMAAATATYVFSGHVHEQKLYYTGASGKPMAFQPVAGTPIPVARNHRWLAIVGSAGQPRDGNNAACYALFDTERERLTFFRIPYDHPSAVRKIRAAGLPERLALRLERGT
jgi:CheY-like chemotaxis protein/diadenosine tetraphosphatase ApaH/serine/threonine PP2A family protein phosphatase